MNKFIFIFIGAWLAMVFIAIDSSKPSWEHFMGFIMIGVFPVLLGYLAGQRHEK